MALDGLLLHQISSELKEYLPCKISKIQNISDVELLWTLRTTKGNRRLLTSFHSTYNRHTPTNTCRNKGVDECCSWGDYYYMEALTRMVTDWNRYW